MSRRVRRPMPAPDLHSFIGRPEWHQHAACRGTDPNWWHPIALMNETHRRRPLQVEQITARAQKLHDAYCSRCPVAEQCASSRVDHYDIRADGAPLRLRRSEVPRPCQNCGTVFAPSHPQGRQKYCCAYCLNQAHQTKKNHEYHRRTKGGLI